jgi:hypothetical protein
MAILIANIGTSDLAIQVDIDNQTYYLPIDFLTEEPNLKEQIEKLSDRRKEIWKNQKKYVTESQVYQDLGFPKGSQQKSRTLTKVLLQQYQDPENTQQWHSRIRLTRIGGVIQKALEMGVNKAFIFVTNQVTDKNPDGEDKDTVYLFQIIEKWIQENSLKFSVEKIEIKADIPANNQDLLLDEFYTKLNDIYNQISNESVLISLKGGTAQMKVALQIQAMTSQFKNLIFLDPQLNIDTLLDGHTSKCNFFSYWRYQRTQKYESVRQLLERWDFDGAIQILKDWQNYLKFLIKHEVVDSEINQSSELIRLVLQRLNIAINYFNLDNSWQLNYPIQPNDNLGSLQKIKNSYDKVLNLYTQCKILWELNQVANFSFKIGSFCEEILHEIINKLDGETYFDKARYLDDWYLTKDKVKRENENFWKNFYELEITNRRNSPLINWDWNRKPSYKLPGRFSKRNFVKALIQFRGQTNEQIVWQKIADSLKKLDYWIELRNTLTHSAEGFSKKSMANLLNHDRNCYKRGDRDEMAIKANQACKPNEILDELTKIVENIAELLKQSYSPYVGLGEPYYIYSDVKQWVVKKLQKEEQ